MNNNNNGKLLNFKNKENESQVKTNSNLKKSFETINSSEMIHDNYENNIINKTLDNKDILNDKLHIKDLDYGNNIDNI